MDELRHRGAAIARAAHGFGDLIGNRLAALYLVVALTMGTGYLFVTPPGAVPDELTHATRAIKLAGGEWIGDSGDRQFANMYHMYGEFNDFLNPETRFTREQLDARMGQPVLCDATTANLPRGADSYGPHLYLFPAATYRWSCHSGASFGVFIWLSRFGNLAISVLLTTLGIALSHRARWPIFVTALMPMSVYQMASLSADAVYFGLCFAWVGLTCAIAEGRIAPRSAGPLLWLLGILIAFSKPGGAWILCAALLLRRPFMQEYSRFWPAATWYVLLPGVAHVAWVLSAEGNAVPLAGVNPETNLQRLLDDPWHFARLSVAAFTGSSGEGLVRSMIGQLGWLDIVLRPWAYMVVLACIAGSLMLARPGIPQPPGTRMLVLLFSAASLLILSLPLYLLWTPEDSWRVEGLQGRYLIPTAVFTLAGLGIAGPRWAQTALRITIPPAVLLPLAHGLFAIANRYYP